MSRSLKELQQDFQSYLLDEDKPILQEIVNTTATPATLRLNIYRDAYYLRLVNILAMDYPVLKKLAGENFSDLAKKYTIVYPSHNFSVRIFGRNFAEFLAKNSEITPIFGEIAKFEWHLAEIQNSADADYLAIDEVGQISPDMWGAMQFSFHPSVRVDLFNYNVSELWQAFNESKELPVVESQKEIQYFIFWRYGLEPRFMQLTDLQLHLFKKFNENKTFGEICEEMCEYIPEEEVVQFAAGTLREWVLAGIFSQVRLTEKGG